MFRIPNTVPHALQLRDIPIKPVTSKTVSSPWKVRQLSPYAAKFDQSDIELATKGIAVRKPEKN